MSELVLEAAYARGLGPLNARFSRGLQLVLARAPADLAALAELLAGVLPARRGRVTLEGEDVGRTPARRREIAALLLDEELIAARDVRTALATVCSLRGISESVEALLAALGASQLSPRDPRTLDARERRLLALSLALGQTSSRVVVLADPLSLASEVGERFLIDACHRLSETAIVIVLTASLTDALQIGGRVWWLERGRLQPLGHGERPSVHQPGLVVRSQTARQLARELETDPAVLSLSYDATRAPYELTLRGPELEALALAVLRTANTLGARLDALHPELPTLDSALLARAGWIDPSYHAHARSEGRP
jgi:ABC-type thiamine transport system ATPase subunit